MPVNGLVKIFSTERKVVVKPADSEFRLIEIVIENIEAKEQYRDKMVEAGKTIGKATPARLCYDRPLDIKVN